MALEELPIHQRVTAIQNLLQERAASWEKMAAVSFADGKNIFLSKTDLALIDKTIKTVRDLIKTTEVKLNNVAMMIR